MAAPHRTELVLFDIGGVLVDPGGVGHMRALSGISSDEELWARWLSCRWVRLFEAGRCSAEDFAAGVVADWDLTLEPDVFLSEFAGWTGHPFPGALELVTDVRAEVPVACLSNANVLQWEANYEATPIVDAFELRFLSFELGTVNPDREIFAAVTARLPVPAERVLFLDDNRVNVDAATEAGFLAAHVRGVQEARAALVSAGVIPG